MNFFLFLWVIFALLDPDPDPLTWLNTDPIRILILNTYFKLHGVQWSEFRILFMIKEISTAWQGIYIIWGADFRRSHKVLYSKLNTNNFHNVPCTRMYGGGGGGKVGFLFVIWAKQWLFKFSTVGTFSSSYFFVHIYGFYVPDEWDILAHPVRI
jgi:hypothetical protein